MVFNNELLTTYEIDSLTFNSSIQGSYSTHQFVLRLRQDVREYLQEGVEICPEKFQAFSTYLHENIHWWQHIGSNFGFILNSSYPSYAVSAFEHLKSLVGKGHLYKSLLKFDEKYFAKNGVADIGDLNVIVNNFYDLEYAKLFCLDNRNIKDIIKDKRFFLSMGHCFMIMWSNSIQTLVDTFDNDFEFLPNFNNWVEKFQNLEANKVSGFYPDSDYTVAPIGIKAIYEGQAVFNQIIYLKNVFKENNIIFKDFVNQGILHGIYLEAFELFLKILGEDTPVFIEDNLIGLFLLICDLSINPTNGFPIDAYDYERFIVLNDPGQRFVLICKVISENKGYYLDRCKELNKQTYIDLSKLISKKIGYKCSYQTLETVKSWTNNPKISKLLEEESSHSYEMVNMPFRVFFAKFIKFQIDKYEYPEIFCWIGNHLSMGKDQIAISIFEKHKALFTDAADGEIKPLIQNGVSDEAMKDTLNKFYFNTMIFELILKWISEEGEFKFDYKWLLNERNDGSIPRLKEEFKKLFNISIDEIKAI